MKLRILAALATVGAMAACATTTTPGAPGGPSATEADFGNSIASLIKAQTADPATLTSPSAAPVTGVDPDYAGNVVKAMREGVSKPADVRQPIEIRVGGSGGT